MLPSLPKRSTFIEGVLQPFAGVIDTFGNAVQFRNTWGDGLYLVLDDVNAAAQCALALQDAMRAVDTELLGMPPLLLRVGAHVGPVFETRDPVTGSLGYFGVEVTRTARVEPGTPPGDVYVTDPFAALVALDDDCECSCQYVGPVPAAKGYGTLPLYTLRREPSRQT
jgi:class 3 adenylate cyclase